MQAAWLRPGAETSRQAEALRRCLDCWGLTELSSIVSKLAVVLESQQECSAGQMVDIMMAAALPIELVLKFCEHVLAKSTSAESAEARNCTELLLRWARHV
jgi:hypothetical protein